MGPNGTSETPAAGLPAPSADWALFLDIDGTLAEIAPTPDAARITPRVLDALAAADDAFAGALALISGRNIADIDSLTAPLRLSAAGQHGAEWRIDDSAIERQPGLAAEDLDPARTAFADLATAHAGVLVEEKGLTLSVHYRLVPAAAETIDRLADAIVVEMPGYHVFRGKAVVEFRPDGIDKGASIERFLQHAPFAGRLPVFAGDDRTDEDGFAVVNRRGGIAIRIGPPPPSVPRSQARWQFRDVTAFTDWLVALPKRIAAHA